MTHGNTFSIPNLAACQQFKVNGKEIGKNHCFPVSAETDLVPFHRIILQVWYVNVMGFEPAIITWFVSVANIGIKFSVHLKVTCVLYFELSGATGWVPASKQLGHGHRAISGTDFLKFGYKSEV